MKHYNGWIFGVLIILFLGLLYVGRNNETFNWLFFSVTGLLFLILPVVIINSIFLKKPGFKFVLIYLILCLILGAYLIIQSTREIFLIESIKSFGRFIYYFSIFYMIPYLLPFVFSQIFLRKNPDLKFNSYGKGMFFGSLIGIAFYIIEGMIYEKFLSGDEDLRILGNIFLGSLMGLMLVVGAIFWIISKFKETKDYKPEITFSVYTQKPCRNLCGQKYPL